MATRAKKFGAMTRTRVVRNVNVAVPSVTELAVERLTAAPQKFNGELIAPAAPSVAPAPPVAPVAPSVPAQPLSVIASVPVPVAEPAPAPVPVPVPAIKSRQDIIRFALKKKLDTYKEQEDGEIHENRYKLDAPPAFIPPTRKGFGKFLQQTYLSAFTLPPILKVDKEGCKKLMAAGASAKVETFLYQEFIREYLRGASPYRGLLVYHGLGSGKTCSAIATAEALYGASHKKIIIMTPGSLRGNFQSQIAFCGFRHFRTDNYWIRMPLDNPLVESFARSVLNLPEQFINQVRRREDQSLRVIFVPDFTRDPNYAEFTSQEQSAVRAQIVASLENRIMFINYNGIPAATLKQLACDPSHPFDNAVIIIDEVHNLTRLMSGKIERYAGIVPGRRRPANVPYEPVKAGRWSPSLCNMTANYSRAFLFYRLLSDARNSKIVALSGTPLINQPDEIGILMNILAGYIECGEGTLTTTRDEDLERLRGLVKEHPRLDSVFFTKGQGSTTFRVSVFPEGYVKVIENGVFRGIREDSSDAAQQPIQAAVEEVVAKAKEAGIPFGGAAVQYTAFPRFPIEKEKFTDLFLDVDAVKVKNDITIMKRMYGLVSYYRGSTEGLMPNVVEDVVVDVPLRGHALTYYTKKRLTEISEEIRSSTSKGDDYMEEKNVTSYRFNSRAACNFAFPKEIARPYRRRDEKSKAEVMDVPVGEVIAEAATEVEDMDAEMRERAAVEAEEAAVEVVVEDVEASEPQQIGGAGDDAAAEEADAADQRPYQVRLEEALRKIRDAKDTYLKVVGASPENSLANYSPKYVAMIEKISAIPGSALVYSQFKSAEGLGIFGFALEANGHVLIDFVGSDRDLAFSPAAEASLRKGPMAGEKRFMFFTGEGSLDTRKTILNIFNANFNQLPPKIKAVLVESGYEATQNHRGEICKVFGITSSGAEGISLKSVRSVHIMEPYWNKVRTEQVKGRAIRICSHADLPEEERNVSIYTYCCTFDQEDVAQKKVDFYLVSRDGGETSDKKVLELGNKKERINDDFLRILKASAVDCFQNSQQNRVQGCFPGVSGSPEEAAFNPSIEADLEMSEQQRFVAAPAATSVAAPPVAITAAAAAAAAAAPRQAPTFTSAKTQERSVITIAGNQYWINPDKSNPSEIAYTLFDVTDLLASKPLGRIVKNPATGKFKKPAMF